MLYTCYAVLYCVVSSYMCLPVGPAVFYQVSRTESAYISHTALSLAISLEEVPDLAIIPESLLAVRASVSDCCSVELRSLSSLSSQCLVTYLCKATYLTRGLSVCLSCCV